MLESRLRKAFGTALVMALVAAALATGCDKAGDAPAADGEPKADAFKVALLSPGPVSDGGWNAIAYEGLQRIERELGATVSQVETKSPAEFEKAFRDYAQRGFDLVFGHGFEFQDAAARVAKDFPDATFITTSGNTVRPNVAPMVFELEQAVYLLGMTAALVGDGAPIAAIGGVEIPSIRSTFVAFREGAKRVRPDIRVVTSYIGSWEDVGAAKEATRAAIGKGAKFIFHNADAAGLGVFQAAQDADGVYVFGSNKDQNGIAPDAILASAVLDIPSAFVATAREVKEDRFEAKIHWFGMPEGIVSIAWNPKLSDVVPDEVRAEVEKVRKEILAGTFEVPRGEF